MVNMGIDWAGFDLASLEVGEPYNDALIGG
jgi:hypothetical protein